MGVAGGHIAFRFNNAGGQQRFLFIGKHPVAAILNGLSTPPRADLVQHLLVLFADGKTGPRTIGQIIDLFFNPADGIFREDRRGADFACLVADDQLVVFDPDSPLRQVMGQRQRATYRDRLIQMLLISGGVMLRALGAYRRLNDMNQRHFMRLNASAQRIQFQGSHEFILVK